ncbi:hypothetical protein ORN01_25395 [Bacillus cereus]|uniref:hypothetical protein n=1 Tax=Bacillus cereus group TaxID=86661 RepID=UPI0022E57D5F|nr:MULTISPECIES: hypothetical protein [Bacillus cereus group]MDA1509587.1 hypothetical protein [Bacillus cereus group sp. TH36-2LC]MDZ4632295.1 hypothetical protein [Bacillus cereus]
MNTVREIIEAKLENGVQTFTAHEVASLLNQIRIDQEVIKTLNETRRKRDNLAIRLENALKEIKELKK